MFVLRADHIHPELEEDRIISYAFSTIIVNILISHSICAWLALSKISMLYCWILSPYIKSKPIMEMILVGIASSKLSWKCLLIYLLLFGRVSSYTQSMLPLCRSLCSIPSSICISLLPMFYHSLLPSCNPTLTQTRILQCLWWCPIFLLV